MVQGITRRTNLLEPVHRILIAEIDIRMAVLCGFTESDGNCLLVGVRRYPKHVVGCFHDTATQLPTGAASLSAT
jgi:hypothetical protein